MLPIEFAEQVFRRSPSKENVVCPPDQVFVSPHFEFLVTMGGHLVENEAEFNSFLSLLREIGEDEFYVIENLGATVTEAVVPFEKSFSSAVSFASFERIVKSFDPPLASLSIIFTFLDKMQNWAYTYANIQQLILLGV